MASTLIQFRIEKDEKQRSSQILETMGLGLIKKKVFPLA